MLFSGFEIYQFLRSGFWQGFLLFGGHLFLRFLSGFRGFGVINFESFLLHSSTLSTKIIRFDLLVIHIYQFLSSLLYSNTHVFSDLRNRILYNRGINMSNFTLRISCRILIQILLITHHETISFFHVFIFRQSLIKNFQNMQKDCPNTSLPLQTS